jgi:hypothetical protein
MAGELERHTRARRVSARVRAACGVAVGAGLIAAGLGFGGSTTAAVLPPKQTIWSIAAPAGAKVDADAGSVELGTPFKAAVAGTVTGVRFWKTAENAGPHVGNLWSATGARLATVTFKNETASGWQTAAFPTPVGIAAGQQYVISYHAPKGRYVATSKFTGKSVSPYLSVVSGHSGAYVYGSTSAFPSQEWNGTQYWVDVLFQPSGSVTTPKPTATATPTATPKPTAPPPRSFPNSSNTGVPAGTTLTPYTGPCTIQTPNLVIDAKLISCDLRILTTGVKITRSRLNGHVDADNLKTKASFTISDSYVDVGNWPGTGIGTRHFTATRVEVVRGSRSINCYEDCTVVDSYVHGQYHDTTGVNHESGIRMGSHATIRHNTITCDAPNYPPDAGCSANLTGYGDFDPVEHNLIENNFFGDGTGGYCTYGGSTAGKPYSAHTNTIVFRGNVWQKPADGISCYWGPITSFDVNAPGNVWQNNTYTDGKPVPPAN